MDNLTRQEVMEIREIVRFYSLHHVSVSNPRYTEISTILEKLSNVISQKANENIHRLR